MMKHLIIIAFTITIALESTGQEMLKVQCVDRRTGIVLKSKHISKGAAFLNKFDGTNNDFGPLIDGTFEIEKACHRGDQYTILVDQGNYMGDTYYCYEIKKFGNKFPLVSSNDYYALLNNVKTLFEENFPNEKAKHSSIAFLNNSIAYFNLNRDSSEYSKASKQVYISLGKVFDVSKPTYYDKDQKMWVATNDLEDVIILYKQENSFDQINGLMDYKFFSHLTGLDAMEIFEPALEIYQKTAAAMQY